MPVVRLKSALSPQLCCYPDSPRRVAVAVGVLAPSAKTRSRPAATRITGVAFFSESMDSWFFPSFFPAELISGIAGPEEAKNLAGEMSSA